MARRSRNLGSPTRKRGRVNHALETSTAGVDEGTEGPGSTEGATDGGSDDGFNVAPGAVGGRGIRRCLGIEAG